MGGRIYLQGSPDVFNRHAFYNLPGYITCGKY